MSLNRDQLIAAATASLPTTEVDVPEWGGKVRVRGMTVGERLAVQARARTATSAPAEDAAFERLSLDIVVMSLVDEAGNRLFDDTERDIVRGFDSRGFKTVLIAAQELNGMRGAEPADGEEPDAVKN